MDATIDKLASLIAEIMEENKIAPEDHLGDDVGMASIDFVELGVAVEKNFGVALPQGYFAQGVTLRDLAQTVEASRQARAA